MRTIAILLLVAAVVICLTSCETDNTQLPAGTHVSGTVIGAYRSSTPLGSVVSGSILEDPVVAPAK